jgi:hypothetical protein
MELSNEVIQFSPEATQYMTLAVMTIYPPESVLSVQRFGNKMVTRKHVGES